ASLYRESSDSSTARCAASRARLASTGGCRICARPLRPCGRGSQRLAHSMPSTADRPALNRLRTCAPRAAHPLVERRSLVRDGLRRALVEFADHFHLAAVIGPENLGPARLV